VKILARFIALQLRLGRARRFCSNVGQSPRKLQTPVAVRIAQRAGDAAERQSNEQKLMHKMQPQGRAAIGKIF
jgi:hypothetical protein